MRSVSAWTLSASTILAARKVSIRNVSLKPEQPIAGAFERRYKEVRCPECTKFVPIDSVEAK